MSNVADVMIPMEAVIQSSVTSKKPQTELLDQEFHAAVALNTEITGFSTWLNDCYDAILTYISAPVISEKKKAALRIARSAWEAADSKVGIGVFLAAISDNWSNGVKNHREPFDWIDMEWNPQVESIYMAKTLRHLVQADLARNSEIHIKHLAALFCNANILWRRCDDLHMEDEPCHM